MAKTSAHFGIGSGALWRDGYGAAPRAAARQMYGLNFQPSKSLKAITYFEGGDLQSLTRKERDALIEAAGSVRNLPQIKLAALELNSQ